MERNLPKYTLTSNQQLMGTASTPIELISNGKADIIQTKGDHITVAFISATDSSHERLAHIDYAQNIPIGVEPNAQYFGATSVGLTFDNLVLKANSQMQGLTQFDGGVIDLNITNCNIETNSQHKLHFSGALSGHCNNNTSPLVLTKMRCGGGLPNAFVVNSFTDNEYIPFEGDGFVYDQRLNASVGVDNFDLYLFRSISEGMEYVQLPTPLETIQNHFNKCLDKYRVATKKPIRYSLSEVISSNEGGYTSFNRGRAGDTGNAKLDLTLTVGELIKLGKLPIGHPRRVHAVGKYQLITQTLIDAVNNRVVKLSTQLTPATQEHIFVRFLLYKKRKSVYKYITTGQRIDRALLSLSKEWASIADPRTGRSYYDKNGNDKAHTSSQSIEDALTTAREGFMVYTEQGLNNMNSFTKSVYFNGNI